jgi:CHASE1-domain containing sensor protein
MSFSQPLVTKLRPRARAVPYLVLAVMLLLTAAVARYVGNATRAQDRLRFDNAVHRTEDDIRTRLEAYLAMLRAGTGMFASHGDATAEEFTTFVRGLKLREHFPGIQGIGFARRVSSSERAASVAAVRARGLSNFDIWPPGEREEYFPILLIEPQDVRNRAAIGFDMFSDPVRHEAMKRAAETGQPAATGRVRLVQELDPAQAQAGFLIYVPVYRGGAEPETVEARRQSLVGFVYSPFRADDLLVGIFGTEANPLIDFIVYDGANPDPESIMHRSDLVRGAASAGEARPLLEETRTLSVGGRPWTVRFFTRPNVGLGAARWLVPLVVVCGVVVSLVLFYVSRAQAHARAEAEAAARSWRASESRFRTVVDQSPSAFKSSHPTAGRCASIARGKSCGAPRSTSSRATTSSKTSNSKPRASRPSSGAASRARS